MDYTMRWRADVKRVHTVHHAWLMERDYDDPHRGRIVALGPQCADNVLVAALLRGEGKPFVLRDAKKCPLYAGRYVADLNYEDSEYGEAPLIEYGAGLGAHTIDYTHPDIRNSDEEEQRFKRYMEAKEAELADMEPLE